MNGDGASGLAVGPELNGPDQKTEEKVWLFNIMYRLTWQAPNGFEVCICFLLLD